MTKQKFGWPSSLLIFALIDITSILLPESITFVDCARRKNEYVMCARQREKRPVKDQQFSRRVSTSLQLSLLEHVRLRVDRIECVVQACGVPGVVPAGEHRLLLGGLDPVVAESEQPGKETLFVRGLRQRCRVDVDETLRSPGPGVVDLGGDALGDHQPDMSQAIVGTVGDRTGKDDSEACGRCGELSACVVAECGRSGDQHHDTENKPVREQVRQGSRSGGQILGLAFLVAGEHHDEHLAERQAVVTIVVQRALEVRRKQPLGRVCARWKVALVLLGQPDRDRTRSDVLHGHVVRADFHQRVGLHHGLLADLGRRRAAQVEVPSSEGSERCASEDCQHERDTDVDADQGSDTEAYAHADHQHDSQHHQPHGLLVR